MLKSIFVGSHLFKRSRFHKISFDVFYLFRAFAIEKNEATFDFALVVVGPAEGAILTVSENEVGLVVGLNKLEHDEVAHWQNALNSRIFDPFEKSLEFRRAQLILELKLGGCRLHHDI